MHKNFYRKTEFLCPPLVDKCPPKVYNVPIFQRRYAEMTGFAAVINQRSSCRASAAASSSARVYVRMDTGLLAVSVFIALLAGLITYI